MLAGQMMRLFVGVILIAGSLATSHAFAQFDYEDGVYQRLTSLGISPDDVIEMNIYPFPDPNDQFGGARAWVKIAQCPDGWIVMTVGRTGTVTYAYARDGCMIPGLD